MRIFVSVPQEYADVLEAGPDRDADVAAGPDKPITAQFLTTANAVVPSTRTIVTELTVDNANRKLWPGTYVNVHFTFPGEPNMLILPEQALLFRAQGMQVAVLDDQDRVHLQDVVLGHNLDTDVQIISGLKATDKVVGNPSLGLLEGQQVKIVQPVAGYQPGQGTARPSRSPSPRRGRRRRARPRRGRCNPDAVDGPPRSAHHRRGSGRRPAGRAEARTWAVAVTGANHRQGLRRIAAHARSALKLTGPVLAALFRPLRLRPGPGVSAAALRLAGELSGFPRPSRSPIRSTRCRAARGGSGSTTPCSTSSSSN